MYEDYFGLQRSPFKITPDTSLFYDGGKRGDILEALVYAVHRGEGIVKVVGEVGSGKTMLCRMLQLKLPKSIEIIYISNPSVSPEDILFVIAHELSLHVGKDASKHEVMHLLQDFLLQRHMENKQVVLFVEEAQGMPIDTLEEIRLLSNLETDQNKLLQIILFGQPELDVNLSQQSIRQLRERITHNFELSPLTDSEIHYYLNFRMREVGYTGPELISKAVAKKVEHYSEGLLRRINIIGDKILLSAFAEGTHNLTSKHVMAAVNDSTFGKERKKKPTILWWLVLLLAVALAFALFQTRSFWLSLQAAENQQNVVKIEESITDIVPQAVETDIQNAVVESSTAVIAMVEHAEISEAQPANVAPETKNSDYNNTDEVDSIQAVDIKTAVLAADSKGTTLQKVSAETVPANLSAGAKRAAPSQSNTDSGLTVDYKKWLNAKLEESRRWLSQLDQKNVSIQTMIRNKSAARELVYFLINDWPLELSKTYVFEVEVNGRSIYRIFYNHYESFTLAKNDIAAMPDSVKVNRPYLNSIIRMQNELL